MALHETPFTSINGRDEIQAWIYEPTTPARAIVQIVHGLGEHSRRYLHLITALLDVGFVVAADDHAGHGRTAMLSGVWQDAGEDGASVVVEDEQQLRQIVTERPHVRDALDAAIAERGGQALDSDNLTAAMFEGFLDRFGEGAGPTDWVASDPQVVADHAVDPYNNFGAPMTLRFGRSFIELYDRANAEGWMSPVSTELPVLLLAGDQDAVADFGRGA